MRLSLVGKARSGKDSISDYLVENYGFKKYNFGAGIYDMANQLFPNEMQEGKNRPLLQELGEGIRKIKNDVWVDYCWRKIQEAGDLSSNIVISDLRQMHEFEALAKKNFIFIKVVSDDEERAKRSLFLRDRFTKKDFNHKTELSTEKIPADYLISNDGTLDELYKKTEIVLTHIKNND